MKPQAAAAQAPAALDAAPALLQEVRKTLAARLGVGRYGLEPMLDELGQTLARLMPGPGDARLSPEEQEKARASFAGTVDTLEDVLEALHRSGRAGHVLGWGER
ncbi:MULTISPECIES: hypothetical protein [unclassified Corallococcus]|uniref:hypothetical protein n=1 Tax=unclassified Corallococcus TaxID=2685029 RepID=UPI0022A9676F|nr:hypothetical protein [Corallococcus sp. NCRR]WAS82500.1 hypothetical protein O0N60_24590 [Corallococcus sp. NCRR]